MTIQKRIEDTSRIFRPDGAVTLADVAARAGAELTGSACRDTASAFRSLTTKLGVDLATVPATPAALRALIGELTPGALGVSPKRLANVRSSIVKAVERFGMRRQVVTRAVPLAPAWSDLLARARPKHYRHGLNRFAAYCSAMAIAPGAVHPDILVRLHEALVAECFVKAPRRIIKHTIALWNHCMRTVEGWPQVRLASPFTREPDTLPLDAFPESFRADVDRWIARMTASDRLDPDGPPRLFRPATVKSYIMLFRRFGSALVRRDVLRLDQITGLAVFFEAKHFEEGLRHFLPNPKETNQYAHYVATKLIHIARHYIRLPEPDLNRLQALARKLDPHLGRSMGRRNRDRLEKFEEPDVVRRFLSFPAAEKARAIALKSPIRRAKAMERALVVSLLIHTGFRIQNLRSLRLDRNIRAGRGRR